MSKKINPDVAELEAYNLADKQKNCDHRGTGAVSFGWDTSAGVRCFKCGKALGSREGALACKRAYGDAMDEFYSSPEFQASAAAIDLRRMAER